MIAFNFYEPVAKLIDSTGIPWGFSDTLCMLGLFCISLGLLRMTTETIAPAMVRFPTPVYHIGRLVFGLGGAVVTMAIVILAFHAAPVHKKIFSVVEVRHQTPVRTGTRPSMAWVFPVRDRRRLHKARRIRSARSVWNLRRA